MNETVIHATGQTWKQWLAYLDKHRAEDLSHKEIVALLSRKIPSGWWCRKLTVAYEQYKGLRVLGQTAGSGFQVGVSRKVPLTKATAWELLSSEKGMAT